MERWKRWLATGIFVMCVAIAALLMVGCDGDDDSFRLNDCQLDVDCRLQ